MERTPPAKAYKIKFEHRPGYLYAYIEGKKDRFEISRQYWLEIAAECKKVACTRVLVEEDIPEAVSMGDAYELATEIPTLGFSKVKVSFVDRYADQVELNQFAELVATNRGLNGRFFTEFSEAEKWLLAD